MADVELGHDCKLPSEIFVSPYPKFGIYLELILVMIINITLCECSVKVTYSGDNSVKAVLLKDKAAKAEPAAKQQQYIEVSLGQNLILFSSDIQRVDRPSTDIIKWLIICSSCYGHCY